MSMQYKIVSHSSVPNLVTVEDIDVSKFLPDVDDYTALKHNFKVLMKGAHHLPALSQSTAVDLGLGTRLFRKAGIQGQEG